MHAQIESFFDPDTCTMTYVVHAGPGACAVIDSVLDYDPKSGLRRPARPTALRRSAQDLRINWLLETHAHADHLSAHHICVGVSAGVSPSVSAFASCRACSSRSSTSSPRSARWLPSLTICLRRTGVPLSAIWKQRHWPCRSHAGRHGVSGGRCPAVFVGDTLFMPDVGTARCDFPGRGMRARCTSRSAACWICRRTRAPLHVPHDYPPGGREAVCHTTVAEQRRANIHVRDGVTEAEFIQMRTKRDAALGMPTLMLPAIQVNIRAGMLPRPKPNGVQYLKIPLNAL